MAENNIGSARVFLDVDATNWDQTLAQAKNAAIGFGREAEAAFDKSSDGARRASARLFDYVASMSRADSQMERLVRSAARAGAERPVLDAAIRVWEEYRQKIAQTNAAMEEAAAINKAFDAQRAANAQRQFNQDYGVDAPQRSVGYREEQARVVRAFTMQLELQEQAEAKLQAQQRAGQDYIKYLQNLKDTAGKTHYEILRLKAAQLGLGQEGSKLVDEIEAQDRAMSKGTITTKQYEWAMRGLPAQFTDIFTSLAAGQNPMMVFLQQGGQIKDMFGGVVPALSAVGGAALKMINPLTVGLAVLGSVALAAYKGSNEINTLNVSLAETGDYAGMTADRARDLARGLDSIAGVSSGGAMAALSEVAKSGRFTADQLDLITTAAVKMQAASGQAISETVDQFKGLQKEPLDALVKLNEQYGFLTAEQYRNIAALQDEGRERDAQAAAMRYYA